MKKEIFFNVFCLFFAGYYQLMSQYNNGFFHSPHIEHYANKIPQTPVASSLGLYGDVPIDHSTGIPNITIPIYTIEEDGLKIPISISYHASGVKVEELSSPVGLKWTLNAGGGFYRTVRGGVADEVGWLTLNRSFIKDSWYENNDLTDYKVQNVLKSDIDFYDHDPDIFNYTFLGNSGKFIFKPKTGYDEAKIIKENYDNIIIKPILKKQFLKSFEVKDTFGNLFLFETKESNQNQSIIGRGRDLSFLETNDLGASTSWLLDTIVTKNNKKIVFNYLPYNCQYRNRKIAQRLICKNKYGEVSCGNEQSSNTKKEILESTSVLYNYSNQLVSVIETNKEKIEFNYSTNPNVSNWKKQLDSIVIYDKIKDKNKKIIFIYDKFSGDPRLKLVKLYEVGFYGSKKRPYTFYYNENYPLPLKESFSKDFWGYYNGQKNPSLIPFTEKAYLILSDLNKTKLADRTSHEDYKKAGVLKGIKYPTGGKTEFIFESNKVLNNNLTVEKEGLRVKSIIVKDINDAITSQTNYEYEGLEGSYWEDLTHRPLGNDYIFSSDYVFPSLNLKKNGYFYKKVIELKYINGGGYLKNEYYYKSKESNYNNYSLKDKIIFSSKSNFKREKIFEYTYKKTQETFWNRAGELNFCYKGPVPGAGLGGMGGIIGYNFPIKMSFKNGSTLLDKEVVVDYLPTFSNTKNYKPILLIKKYKYNEDLLVTKEIIEGRLNKNYSSIVDAIKNEPSAFDVNGSYYEVRTTYPSDYKGNSFFRDLVSSKNLKALPVSRTISNKKKQIQGEFFTYDNMGNVKEKYSYNKGGSANGLTESYIPDNYELSVTYTNVSGKPTQVVRKDGTVISYLWDTTDTYILAKVENATYSKIISLIPMSLDVSQTDVVLRNHLNTLRNSLPESKVTTYTYDPLIGVTSITDPRGETIYYHYDGFGRLKLVKDSQGNILKEYHYNYQQN